MSFDLNYILALLNSTIRSTTPVLLAALGNLMCSQVGAFNIALEGQLLIGSFVSIVVNYYTHSVLLSILRGIIAGALVGALVGVLQIKYKGADMVIGTSVNILVMGLTSIFLSVIWGVRGGFKSPELVTISKIKIPFLSDLPIIGDLLTNLTIIDYLSYIIAILIYIYLYKTVSGFRFRSVGYNAKAAKSLGINDERTKINSFIISGALCGLGGVSLSMGQVTLFIEGMTAGRGYIAMAAANMGRQHPIYSIFSSLFFGAFQAFGTALQNIIPSQLTMTIPYIFTIAAIALFGHRSKKAKKKHLIGGILNEKTR